MVNFKTTGQAHLDLVIQSVKETIKNFSEASKNQTNLSAESAQLALSQHVVSDLLESNLIKMRREKRMKEIS